MKMMKMMTTMTMRDRTKRPGAEAQRMSNTDPDEAEPGTSQHKTRRRRRDESRRSHGIPESLREEQISDAYLAKGNIEQSPVELMALQ